MNSSFEAERRLCAIAMHRNDWVEEADLRIDQFEAAQFGNLYATIKRMVLAGQSANPATLQISMKDAASFAELQTLYNETSPGTKKAFLSLAKAIQEASGRRELKRAVEDALALVTDTNESPLTLLSQVEELVRGVDAGSGSKMLTLRDHALSVAKSIGDPNKRGLMTGWAALDKRLGGIMPGNLVVIAGRPGSGKSSFGMNLARVWGQNGLAGHVASYEMGSAQIGERIIGAMGDLDYSQIRREPDRFNATDIEAIAMTAPDNVVADPTSAQSLAQLEMSARATKRKFGLDFIIVDYLQLMQGQARGSAQERVAEVSKGLKSLAIRLNVPVIALCQINRSAEAREGNRPQLGDMRESGAIEQDADIVLGMYREAYYLANQKPDEANQQEFRDWAHKYAACRNVLEVLTLKNRMGPTGTDKLAIYLEKDRIESFTGPALVPSRRMGREYE